MNMIAGRMRRFLTPAVTVSALMLASQALAAPKGGYDYLILNGRVVDGSGNPYFIADIGVKDDKIVAIGDLKGTPSTKVIDATGKYVTPGFIDLHSHGDQGLVSDDKVARGARNLVTQGITTIVGGPDGRNQKWPLSSEISALRSSGIALNFAPMVGHGTVRSQVMGADHKREANEQEVAAMQELVRQGMEEGAWGLGAGLEYRPGRYSKTEEVVALASVVAKYDGFYTSHQRAEGSLPHVWQVPSLVTDWPVDGVKALQETIRVAEETGIRVVGSHMKSEGYSSFGRSTLDIKQIQDARAKGHQVYLDIYPYEQAGGTTLIVPQYMLLDELPATIADRELDRPEFRGPALFANSAANLRRNLADPELRKKIEGDIEYLIDLNGGADGVIFVEHSDKALIGKSLQEVSAARKETPLQTVIAFALQGTATMPEGARYSNYAMHDDDIARYLQQDFTGFSSDAGVHIGAPEDTRRPFIHPRLYGTYPRAFALFVREKKAITLPSAVRAATALPAHIIGLRDRGLLAEGYYADIVIFDFETIRDRATMLDPAQFSEGISHVMSNGTLILDEGKVTDARPGRVLLKTPKVKTPVPAAR